MVIQYPNSVFPCEMVLTRHMAAREIKKGDRISVIAGPGQGDVGVVALVDGSDCFFHTSKGFFVIHRELVVKVT